MKVGIQTVAFEEERFIGACVDQFKDFPIEKHLVLASTRSYDGLYKKKGDRTVDIAKSHGAKVLEHWWRSQKEQRMACFEIMRDYDWVLVVDPDEYYTKDAIKKMLAYLEDAPQSIKMLESYRMDTYWKSDDFIIKPGLHAPVVAVRPTPEMIGPRSFHGNKHKLPDGVITYHLSWVKTDDEVLKKILTYSGENEVHEDWYVDKWLNWTERTRNFNPTYPKAFMESVRSPLPKEIKDRIKKCRGNL